jgi:formate--tetrahydrofolate ligase
MALADLKREDIKALGAGIENLEKHLENLQSFGPPVVVAINRFPDDTEAELSLLRKRVAALGAKVVLSEVWAKGGEGGLELAEEVVKLCEVKQKPPLNYAYELGMSIPEKIEAIAKNIYGADGVDYHYEASAAIDRFTRLGYGTLPVCMAKTQSSLSDDKTKTGRPRNWKLTVREIRLSAGAGMVIPVCGSIMTMPGLPARPAAEDIDLVNGEIVGLF